MSWIDIVWSMCGAASLTLGLIHFSVWFNRRTAWVHLAFSLVTVWVAVMAVLELFALRAGSPGHYASILRWGHVAYALMVLSSVAYVHLRFKASRGWLAVLVCIARLSVLPANFLTGDNINFKKVEALATIHVWGDHVAGPIGVANPWMLLGLTANLLFLVYLADTLARSWSQSPEQRSRALMVCGSLFLFLVSNNIWTGLVVFGVIHAPIVVNVSFGFVILVIGYELGGDVLRAAALSESLARSQRNLREGERRFRLVVENAPYAILMIGMDGRISLVNSRAEHLLGYKRAELKTLDLNLLFPLESYGRQFDRLVAMSTAARDDVNDVESGVLVVRRKDGSDVPVEIVLTAVRVEDLEFTIASITDVSEKLRLARHSALQRDELAHLSRIALLGEVAGSLAHELSQPLTAVLSNAQAALRFMKHDPPDLGEVYESLLQIVESDKRASEIIRNLRGMMRKDVVKYERIDVNLAVHETLQLVGTDLINRNASYLLDVAPDLPMVLADPVQIKQVLLNLIVNACDAMQAKTAGRVVTLRTMVHVDGTVGIDVSDTGSGIAEEDLERIFTAFVTTKSEGIGLGLAISRTIIQDHGGSLWASNNEHAGATFHLKLLAESV